MQALWHWLAALGEVYTRHASRHGPTDCSPRRCSRLAGARWGTPNPLRRALVPTKARRSTPHQEWYIRRCRGGPRGRPEKATCTNVMWTNGVNATADALGCLPVG